jgi:hypothetical protein
MTFSGKKIYYVGINLVAYNNNFPYFMSIFGSNDTLLGTASYGLEAFRNLYFWGVVSTEAISRITFNNDNIALNEIMFGCKFPWPSYLPAIIGNRVRW